MHTIHAAVSRRSLIEQASHMVQAVLEDDAPFVDESNRPQIETPVDRQKSRRGRPT